MVQQQILLTLKALIGHIQKTEQRQTFQNGYPKMEEEYQMVVM